jgi:hypothetical protein
MNIALSQLVQALRRTLDDNVRPELHTDHARGQLAAVQDILGKLETMAVWSPDAVAQQTAVLLQACADFRAAVARAGVDLCLPETLPAGGDDDALRDAQAQLMQLTDWLFGAGATLARPLQAQLDAILSQAMREQLIIQRKLIPLTDFGAMTSAARP